MRKKKPDLKYELPAWEEGRIVFGVDEVGRGPLAGPVYIGVVALRPVSITKEIKAYLKLGINDSKKLTSSQRSALVDIIKSISLFHTVEWESVESINSIGIVPSIHTAIRRGVEKGCKEMGLHHKWHCLLDAFNVEHLPYITKKDQSAIIRGDGLSISIAAASVLAKVARDAYMTELHKRYPAYGWAENKGYATKMHRDAIVKHGVTEHHRSLFVRKILGQQPV
jgi:ribonuclease HII